MSTRGEKNTTRLNEFHEVNGLMTLMKNVFFLSGGADSKKEKLNGINEFNECT